MYSHLWGEENQVRKKRLSIVVALLMTLGILCLTGAAAEALTVRIDGNAVSMDVEPFIDDNGRTMAPVRFVGEALAAVVDWDASTRTVTITKGASVIKLVVDSPIITINGATTTMDAVAVVRDGRTFVPVRYIAEALGLDVGWDGTTSTVILTTSGLLTTPNPSIDTNLIDTADYVAGESQPTTNVSDISAEEAVALLRDYLNEDGNHYWYDSDKSVNGKECYYIYAYNPAPGKITVVGHYYVSKDGKEIYELDVHGQYQQLR